MPRHPLASEVPTAAITVLCAWCGTILAQGGRRISHGLCERCRHGLDREIDELAAARTN